MIRAVKEAISIPLVAGGGIRTPEQAEAVAEAGADIMVTGTIVEEAREPGEVLGEIVQIIRRKPIYRIDI